MKVLFFGSAILTTPVVPRLDQTNVEAPQPLNAPRAQGLSAEAFGAGLGHGIQQAGNTGLQIAKEEKDKADAAVVMKATTDAYDVEKSLVNQTKDLVGQSAIGSADVLLKDFDDKNSKIRAGLPDDGQRQAFDKILLTRRHAFDTLVNDHERTQVQSYNLANAEGATDAARQRAGLYVDKPDLFESSRLEMERNAKTLMAIKGFGPDSDATKETLSKLNSQVFSDQVEAQMRDPLKAKETFDAYKERGVLRQNDIERLAPKIEVAVDVVEAKAIGAEVFSRFIPATVNDVLRIDEMRKEVRGMDLTPKRKELAEKYVEEQSREYQEQRRINEESASQRIYGLGKDKKTPYLEVVREINSDINIDNKTKASLLDWADRTYGISEARREALSEARAEERNRKNLVYMGNLLNFQNNYLAGNYGTMQPGDVAKHIKELGPLTDNAMQFVNHVNNDPAAKVTDEQLKDQLRILAADKQYKGMLPNVDKPSEQDKGKLALLQGYVQEIMAASKKVDGPNKVTVNQAILQSIKKVTTDKGWISDTEEPMYLLGTKFATKYGQDPARWSKTVQDDFIRQQFYLKNPKGKLTPFMTEKLRWNLLQGAD